MSDLNLSLGLGTDGFIPGLGLPNLEVMKSGPGLRDDSILKNFMHGKSLAEIFDKDVLEQAQEIVGIQYQGLYGNMRFTVDILVVLTADGPVLPAGNSVEGKRNPAGINIYVSMESIEKTDKPILNNPWFSTNMIMRLTMNMMNISEQMKESALSELSVTLTSMIMFVEFAKSVAEAILKSAEKQAEMYKMQAVEGIMKAIGGVTQIIMGVGAIYCHAKASKWKTDGDGGGSWVDPKTDKPPAMANFTTTGVTGAIASICNGLGSAINNFVSAQLLLEKAQWDAYKVIQEVLKQFFEQNMTSSMEAQKELQEVLVKTLNELAQITSSNRRAAGINPHGGT